MAWAFIIDKIRSTNSAPERKPLARADNFFLVGQYTHICAEYSQAVNKSDNSSFY